MSFTEKLYNVSPVFLQNALVSMYGWQWHKRRFGGIFQHELAGFRQRESFTSEQWKSYVDASLKKMLLHAYDTVPYYRTVWDAAGVTKVQLNNITTDSLSALPMLDKESLRKYGTTELLSANREKGGSFFSSSGSTGTPTSILFSHPMHQRWSAAYEARVRNWAGVDRHMRRGMIGGRKVVPHANATPPYYRYNSVEKQVYFSAYHISAKNAANYVAAMHKYQPEYMVGYAMANYLLARFIKEENLSAPRMKAVLTSSEKLTQEMRDVFHEVYGCKTYDAWSGVEACGLVSECEHGSLHISPDVGIIELLDKDGRPVKPGEIGEVVCTGLLNYDQPLIRYRIGDYMRLAEGICSCGRHMPVVDEIIGRLEDVVVTKDGREMVRFHSIFTGMPNIIKGQVVQEAIDDIALNIVAVNPLTESEKQILKERLYNQLGNVNVYISELKEIPVGANGKFRAVISKIKKS